MTEEFTTYEAAIDWLFYELPRTSTNIFSGTAGFEKTRKILEEFGNPQDNYRTIHIAGTSGKGTTAKLITDVLHLHHKSVGTVMSPHVYDLRERFLVDGQFVKTSEVKQALEELRSRFVKLNKQDIYPTYFEATLVLAYEIFKRHELDYLVVETGFGGLLDGTNLISRDDKIVVLTQIGLDHTEILGSTVELIAKQKAGIITPKAVVFALDQESEVNAVFRRAAKQKDSAFELVKPDKEMVTGGCLPGDHHQGNIALSWAAAGYVAKRDGWKMDKRKCEDVLRNFTLPGRFEKRQLGEKRIILDGAHNEQKLRALVDTIQQLYPGRKFSVVFGSAKNRKYRELIEILKPIAGEFVFTMYQARKSDTKRSAQDFTDVRVDGANTSIVNKPEDVLGYISQSDSRDWLVTGSFYVVSEIGRLLS